MMTAVKRPRIYIYILVASNLVSCVAMYQYMKLKAAADYEVLARSAEITLSDGLAPSYETRLEMLGRIKDGDADGAMELAQAYLRVNMFDCAIFWYGVAEKLGSKDSRLEDLSELEGMVYGGLKIPVSK